MMTVLSKTWNWLKAHPSVLLVLVGLALGFLLGGVFKKPTVEYKDKETLVYQDTTETQQKVSSLTQQIKTLNETLTTAQNTIKDLKTHTHTQVVIVKAPGGGETVTKTTDTTIDNSTQTNTNTQVAVNTNSQTNTSTNSDTNTKQTQDLTKTKETSYKSTSDTAKFLIVGVGVHSNFTNLKAVLTNVAPDFELGFHVGDILKQPLYIKATGSTDLTFGIGLQLAVL